jgi:hypothetical protein
LNRESILAKTKTDEFKTKRNSRLHLPENKEKMQTYSMRPEVKEKVRKTTSTAEARQKQKNMRQQPEFKKQRTAYNRDPKNIERRNSLESRKKAIKKRHQKVRNNPGLRLQESLRASVASRLRGGTKEVSDKFKKFTEFESTQDVVRHFTSKMKPLMTLENYGAFWSIAHKIPVCYYDSSIEEDVGRCNSKLNLGCDYSISPTPTGELTNFQKSTSLPPLEELKSMVQCFPLSWNGALPSKKVIDDVLVRVHGKGGRASHKNRV